MVTYSELFQFCLVIIGVVGLDRIVNKHSSLKTELLAPIRQG